MKYSKDQRLLTKSDYSGVCSSGKRYVGRMVVIFYRLDRSPHPRLGITIKKKWGKAHDRNRFKRIVREAYRSEYGKLPSHIELNVCPQKSQKSVDLDGIKRDLRDLVDIC